MDFSLQMDLSGRIIDVIGVVAIVIGVCYSISHYLVSIFRSEHEEKIIPVLRRNLGNTIMVGLELLIAGDIIRSIAVPPTFSSVGILAIIVVIRSFLSYQIGRDFSWPLELRKK